MVYSANGKIIFNKQKCTKATPKHRRAVVPSRDVKRVNQSSARRARGERALDLLYMLPVVAYTLVSATMRRHDFIPVRIRQFRHFAYDDVKT